MNKFLSAQKITSALDEKLWMLQRKQNIELAFKMM